MQTRMQRLGWREPCQWAEFAGSRGRPHHAPKGRSPKGAEAGGGWVVLLAWGGRTPRLATDSLGDRAVGRTDHAMATVLCPRWGRLVPCSARRGGCSAISVGTTAQPCQPLPGNPLGWPWVLLAGHGCRSLGPAPTPAGGCWVSHPGCCWTPVSDITGDAGQNTPSSKGCRAGDSGGASLGRLRPGQC